MALCHHVGLAASVAPCHYALERWRLALDKITFRLPRELHEAIRARASRARRTKNAELVVLLELAIGERDSEFNQEPQSSARRECAA